MFKEAISTLAGSLLSATKNTAKSYIPTSENIHGSFERIAQNGIANLSFRSPVLADIAQTMLLTFQAENDRREHIRSFIKSDKANDIRSTIASKMGGNVSSAKVDSEMLKTIQRLHQEVDREGVEAVKRSDVFKDYEKYFDEFVREEKTQPNTQSPTSGDGVGEATPILNKIDTNTSRTVNVLEEIAARNAVTGASGGSTGGQSSSGVSFIDPITGMPSVRAAVGSIGGSFLAKIFDNETISRFADKLKGAIGAGFDTGKIVPERESVIVPEYNQEPAKVDVPVNPSTDIPEPVNPEPAKKPRKAKVSTTIKDNIANSISNIDPTLGLGGTKNITRENLHKDEFVKVSEEDTSESAREIEAAKEKRAEKLKAETHHSNEDLDKLVKLAEEDKKRKEKQDQEDEAKNPKKKGLLDKAFDYAKEKVGGKVKGFMGKGAENASIEESMVSAKNAAKIPGEAVATVAEGAGGSLLARGAGMLIGGAIAGTAGLGTLGAVVGAGALAYGGYKLYDSLSGSKPEANPSHISTQLNNVTKQQEARESQTQEKPIVIQQNSSVTNSGSGDSGGSQIVVASNIRNIESTFERVQMQDFWPRAK